MNEDILVKVENVSKKFCRSLKKSLWYGVKDITSELNPFQAGDHNTQTEVHLRDGEFWAVNDISFELRRGECLGLIGRNGAGKTTLLKMLNGLIKPDSGRIEMRGRIGALIALGAGFNPVLSGRENILVNAAVLGLKKKQIDEKIDDIIEFSEIGEFIDAPVQSYSSGMVVRLGFAVATALEPDVLILDEVLAVGDASFRNKCYNRIGKMHKSAATIFVSHSMDLVSLICDRALVMSKGRTNFLGDVPTGIGKYEDLNTNLAAEGDTPFEKKDAPVGAFSLRISPSVPHGQKMIFDLEIECMDAIPGAVLRIVFYNPMHVPCAEWNSRRLGQCFDLEKGKTRITIPIGPLNFKTGLYPLGIALNDSTGIKMLIWSYKAHAVQIESFSTVGPDVILASPAEIVNLS